MAAALTEFLKAFRDRDGERNVFVLGTASSASDVAPLLRRCFTHELKAGEANLICLTGSDYLQHPEPRSDQRPIPVYLLYTSTFAPVHTFHGTINTSWGMVMVRHWDNPEEEMGSLSRKAQDEWRF